MCPVAPIHLYSFWECLCFGLMRQGFCIAWRYKMIIDINACLVVKTKKKLRNGYGSTKPGSIGYVPFSAAQVVQYGIEEPPKLYIKDIMLPKSRGIKWYRASLINEPADNYVEVVGSRNTFPNFVYYGNNNYAPESTL
jgi:hypothetical protein